MNFFFNPHNLISVIYDTLFADSTLQGATYLNGTNKIFTYIAPRDISLPYLVIEVNGNFVPDEMQVFTGEVRIFNYNELLSNGQINSNSNAVLVRCEELLNNNILSITGMSVKPLISKGIVPHFRDPIEPDRSRGVLRLGCTLGKNN